MYIFHRQIDTQTHKCVCVCVVSSTNLITRAVQGIQMQKNHHLRTDCVVNVIVYIFNKWTNYVNSNKLKRSDSNRYAPSVCCWLCCLCGCFAWSAYIFCHMLTWIILQLGIYLHIERSAFYCCYWFSCLPFIIFHVFIFTLYLVNVTNTILYWSKSDRGLSKAYLVHAFIQYCDEH